MAPGKDPIDASHGVVEAVVGGVADGNHAPDAAGRGFYKFSEVCDSFVAADVLRILHSGLFPGFDDAFVNIDSRDAKRSEKVSLAAFINAEARKKVFWVQNLFVTDFSAFEDERFQHEFDELARSLSLHNEFSAFINDKIDFVFPGGERGMSRRGHELIVVVPQVGL